MPAILTIEDVLAAARAVASAGRQGQGAVEATAALLEDRRRAAAHMRRHGAPHPVLGDGTLASAARRRIGREAPSTRALLAAAACVCQALSCADESDDHRAPRE
ncbi:MAG: hypothetical protein ACK4WC_06800 [Rubrimonas sp.]